MKFYRIFVGENVESDFIIAPSLLLKKYNNVRRGRGRMKHTLCNFSIPLQCISPCDLILFFIITDHIYDSYANHNDWLIELQIGY